MKFSDNAKFKIQKVKLENKEEISKKNNFILTKTRMSVQRVKINNKAKILRIRVCIHTCMYLLLSKIQQEEPEKSWKLFLTHFSVHFFSSFII